MAWSRYDDELPYNRKVAELKSKGVDGLAALGLHLLANTWSRHQGTGGHIPSYMPEQLAGRCGPKLAAILANLRAGPMFDPVDDGWMVHDFDEFSGPDDDGTPVAEKKRRVSEARAAAGSKGGKAKAKRLANAKQNSSKASDLLVANEWHSSSPVPDPVPDCLTSERGPTSLPTVGSDVDNSRRERIARLYGQHAAIQAKATSPNYWRTCAERIIDSHDMAVLLAEYPDAPDSVIAAALHGERHSLVHYRKQQPMLRVVGDSGARPAS